MNPDQALAVLAFEPADGEMPARDVLEMLHENGIDRRCARRSDSKSMPSIAIGTGNPPAPARSTAVSKTSVTSATPFAPRIMRRRRMLKRKTVLRETAPMQPFTDEKRRAGGLEGLCRSAGGDRIPGRSDVQRCHRRHSAQRAPIRRSGADRRCAARAADAHPGRAEIMQAGKPVPTIMLPIIAYLCITIRYVDRKTLAARKNSCHGVMREPNRDSRPSIHTAGRLGTSLPLLETGPGSTRHREKGPPDGIAPISRRWARTSPTGRPRGALV